MLPDSHGSWQLSDFGSRFFLRLGALMGKDFGPEEIHLAVQGYEGTLGAQPGFARHRCQHLTSVPSCGRGAFQGYKESFCCWRKRKMRQSSKIANINNDLFFKILQFFFFLTISNLFLISLTFKVYSF